MHPKILELIAENEGDWTLYYSTFLNEYQEAMLYLHRLGEGAGVLYHQDCDWERRSPSSTILSATERAWLDACVAAATAIEDRLEKFVR